MASFYKDFLKPFFFRFDPEFVHESVVALGELIGEDEIAKFLLGKTICFRNKKLERTVGGIKFKNPLGLAAGFDYDGRCAAVLKSVGFGFNTVGTVTAKPYGGNPKPRLGRLPNSKSLFVNKGFKNQGVAAIAKRLEDKNLTDIVLGISVGASNLSEVDSIGKAIDDYLFTFEYLKNKKFVRYFELNISCPNTALPENFTNPKNLEVLVKKIAKVKLGKPVFVKMPNEITPGRIDPLIEVALKHGISGFILSNLVKDRKNKYILPEELKRFTNFKGNFSGRPCFEGSNRLIAHVSKKYGRDAVIIGCGGVFTAQDALVKFQAGADLVQMVTGLIFEGPQVAGRINRELATLL